MAAQRPDLFMANSKITQERIQKYYGRSADIIYPGVDLDQFKPDDETKQGIYYLVLTRLSSWKRVDIAVKAAMKMNFSLKVIGDGPDIVRLRKIARGRKNIEFLGYVKGQERRKYILGAIALINTQFEDFGIVPLEVMSCGKPVIAYAKGGATETVLEGKTGEFFQHQNEDSLCRLIEKFDPAKYDPRDCIEQAEKFSEKVFSENISSLIHDLMVKEGHYRK
jgi:glycosyltransferase involved in cell wall biosynthesis